MIEFNKEQWESENYWIWSVVDLPQVCEHKEFQFIPSKFEDLLKENKKKFRDQDHFISYLMDLFEIRFIEKKLVPCVSYTSGKFMDENLGYEVRRSSAFVAKKSRRGWARNVFSGSDISKYIFPDDRIHNYKIVNWLPKNCCIVFYGQLMYNNIIDSGIVYYINDIGEYEVFENKNANRYGEILIWK